jgi:KDO2-lipid IV(A) lauroyltransferase
MGLKTIGARWREGIEFGAFRAIAAIASALPMETASDISGWCWRKVAPRLKRHQRALDNIARAYPDLDLAARERMARDSWENLGRTFAEFFHMPQIIAQRRVAVESVAEAESFVASAPLVVCVPHMANWEVIAQVSAQFGLPVAGTYQAMSNSLVDQWAFKKRAPMYKGGLFEKSHATARAMIRLAKKGVSPAFVADLREGRGVPALFFGHRAMSNPFPALIARTVGMPLYAARVKRQPGVRFTIRVETVEVPVTEDRDAPEQWMWAHRRWD